MVRINAWQRHTNVRMFSSTPTYPFVFIDHLLNIKDDKGHDGIELRSENHLPNGCKQNFIVISDSTLRDEVYHAMTAGFFRLSRYDISCRASGVDKSKSIIIEHKPSNPEIADVSVSLPLLPSGSKIQNIAMSCLPVRDKDWVVGLKLSGSRVSLCRPFGNRKWFNIEAMPEFISPYSSLMFSKGDFAFYVPSPGGKHLCSFDDDFEEQKEEQEKDGDEADLIDITFDQLPKSVLGELEDVSSCSRTDHLVESPTGELYLVKWYCEDLNEYYSGSSLTHKTKQFMVFRVEDTEPSDKKMIYTEDIGDLCILLGHGEALCVPASSSPGLRPNCIYFVGYNFGVYDLTTKTCTTFLEEDDKDGRESLLRKLEFPYWPLPLPLA